MSDKNFLGLPVQGDITYYTDKQVEQWPIEQFQPIIQALLDDPEVECFGWRQYTPYFNDGDACVFSCYGAWVKPVKSQQEEIKPNDYDYDDDDPEWKYEVRSYSWSDQPKSPEHHIALEKAIEGGHFDMVLLEHFGDPASVTVYKDRIEVDFFDHD